MNAFEEYCFGNDYILRFYRVDHGLICTINESMVAELRAVEAKINQQQAEIEALRNRNWDLVSEPWGFDRHSYKPSKSEVDALLDNADYVVGIMREEIEEWKRKYKDMHNLATQAMSKVHQLEKEASEK